MAKMVVSGVEMLLTAEMEWISTEAPTMAEGLTFRTQPQSIKPSDGDPASVAVANATEYLESIGIEIESAEVFPQPFDLSVTVGGANVY
jgi:hypothetical protein